MRPAAVKSSSTPRRTASRAMGLAGTIVLVMAVAGCNGHRKGPQSFLLTDPEERHPIQVSRKPVEFDVSVPRGAYGLTRSQRNEVRAFARRYKSDGEGPLVIRAPSGSPNEVASMRAIEDMRRVLSSEKVPAKAIEFEPYLGDGAPDAPVRLSYLRYVAEGPVCGDFSTNLARSPRNREHPNFGCTAQHNLAAMVANPRDLVRPRGMTPRSSERRDVVWDKYVKGETTVSEKSEDEAANVSEVGGGGG